MNNLSTKIQFLEKVTEFVTSDFAGASVATRAGCLPSVEHAEQRIQLLNSERADRVCVLLLGEFKSGKSTLINSLLGRVVAATDVFEMTAAVCRIIPQIDRPERAVLISRDKSLQREMSIENFIAITKEHSTARRHQEQGSLNGYTQVQIFINTPLDIELVDTPGLGATLENELIALDAVSSSDVILWTMDVESIGGAREAAILERMKVSGQPVLIALTKSDLTDKDEMTDIVAYVSKTYGISASSIFPVSAQEQLNTGKELGLLCLKSALQSLAPGRAFYREKALHAQASDIAAELTGCIEMVREAIEEALTDAAQNLRSMRDMACVVTRDICLETGLILKSKLEKEIEAILIGQIGIKRARLTQEDFQYAIEQSIQKVNTQDFWEVLKKSVAGQFQKEWSEGIKAQLEILTRSIEDARDEAKEVSLQFSEELFTEKTRRLQRKKQAVAGAVQSGLVAVTLIVVHLPLLVVAAVAGPGMWAWYSNKSAEEAETPIEEIEYNIHLAIREWLDQFVVDIMTDFEPKLLKENEIVAQAAAENYAKQRSSWPAEIDDLVYWVDQCNKYLEELANISRGEPLQLGLSN